MAEDILLVVEGVESETFLGGGDVFIHEVVLNLLDEFLAFLDEIHLFLKKLSGGLSHELGADLILEVEGSFGVGGSDLWGVLGAKHKCNIFATGLQELMNSSMICLRNKI